MIEEIASYLQEQGAGEIGKDLFLSAFPAGTAECAALFEYQGLPGNQAAGIETPGLQVAVRGSRYDGVYARIRRIHWILSRVGMEEGETAEGVQINGTRYFRIAPAMSGVLPLGTDETGLITLARNYYVTKEEKE